MAPEISLRAADRLSATETGQWEALFAAQAEDPGEVVNPFTAPSWVLAWYRHFVAVEDRVLLWIEEDGQLVGVAPFYRGRVGISRFRFGTRLQLVGLGLAGSPLELPQVLTRPGAARTVLAGLVQTMVTDKSLLSRDTWAEISVGIGQGWFEPQWVHDSGQPFAFWRHQAARACVVLPLEADWESTRSRLKRNVKESLRRSRNRLKKDGRPYAVEQLGQGLDAPIELAAVDEFLGLHRHRSSLSGRPSHHDAYARPDFRRFMRDLLPELGDRGLARLARLRLGDRVVASQLILEAPGTWYVHSSGFDPDEWALGPVTYIQEQVFEQATQAGVRWINLSPGPNLSKMRWSERMAVSDDFAFGSGGKALRSRYTAFAAGSAVSQVNHVSEEASRASRSTGSHPEVAGSGQPQSRR
ncbi:CelD/BcsL family acetyltransferase involved in cellulose biosynthesis [Friedmanniella endophytica]|uniref:CelD/BcsL family acetyltransferase involved in cellulose biosynthesis n=1 Tax=Microlunatus kandeliicorticis TaxID=1759536 RepID=A0A7W3IQC0_9ACTN|nr:GNAT family N-acetyltransferase [Microlunatus kandeliicorticis]MBA8793250.1 CelD/BcsL family acetyltransferase involved in cellulose biosynthesis [Microlunatus kandeliicorticis]